MLSSSKVRKLGWLGAIAGGFLVALITFVMVWEVSSRAHWEGTAELARFAITLETLLLALGLVAIGAGIWQIKYGKRNKTLTYITLALAVAAIVVAFGHQLSSRD